MNEFMERAVEQRCMNFETVLATAAPIAATAI